MEEEELLRTIIKETLIDFEFEEKNEVKEITNESEVVIIKTISKGIFRSKDGYSGVFLNSVSQQNYPEVIRETIKRKDKVLNLYEGENYLLALTEHQTFAFKVELYKRFRSIINSIDTSMPIEEERHWVAYNENQSFNIFVIETNVASFMIAGLLGDGYDEEERVILSNKLEKSRPFFDFKAPINFDWGKLIGDKDRQFERVCELLLQKEKNISRIIPIGKTRAADRGRDFDVVEKIETFGKIEERKWLVQCKFSDNSISPNTISGWTDRVLEHNYYGFWLMTNNDITPSLFDQFKDIEKNENININTKFWQRSDFYLKLNVHSELFKNNDIFELS